MLGITISVLLLLETHKLPAAQLYVSPGVLRMLSASPAGGTVSVTWQSVAGINYFLQRGEHLAPLFMLAPTNSLVAGTNFIASTNIIFVATDIIGQPGTTTYTDSNASGGPFFYRVGVKGP